MNVKRTRTVKGPRETTRPPATLQGRVAVLALTAMLTALAGFTLARVLDAGARRTGATPHDGHGDGPSALMSQQAREIETLQRRIATLSARLTLATSCSDLPAVPFEAERKAPARPQPAVLAGAAGSRDLADGGGAADAPTGDLSAVATSARDAAASPLALLTPAGTEDFLRELARTSAAGLSLDQALCSDDVCRLAISGRGSPADDALALQNFVGRTAEWLPRTLIQPGAAGNATVVLLARPGHDLPPSTSVIFDH